MIVVRISDGAAQAPPKRPHVLAWTDLRKRSQKPDFLLDQKRSGGKSRMAASDRRPASRRK
jgi:hypothetical protein